MSDENAAGSEEQETTDLWTQAATPSGPVPPPPPPPPAQGPYSQPTPFPRPSAPQYPVPPSPFQQSPYSYPPAPGSVPSAQSSPGMYSAQQSPSYPPSYPPPPQPPAAQPQEPERHRGRTIGIIAAVLVAAVGVGLGIRYARGGGSGSEPAAATSPSSAGSNTGSAETGAGSTPVIANDGTAKPTPALVRQLFGDDSLNISWVSLSTTGQTAVAFAPDFSIDGRSASQDGGHLVMMARGGQWQKLPNGVITTQEQCSALMQLGDKEAVNASAVMNQKFCDPEVIYRLVSTAELDTAGLGALHITKAVEELSTTQLLPADLSGSCVRSTPPYSSYQGFVPDIWTKDGTVQAFAVEGGSNRTRSGAGIGTSAERLTQIYGSKLTDVTNAFPTEAIDTALALDADGSEMDFLISGGDVTKIIVRNSNFSTSQC